MKTKRQKGKKIVINKGKKIETMKKMIILVSAIVMTLTAGAENMNVNPFEDVNVNVPARVRFVYGETYGVDIQATDSLAASGIRWSVKDGVLKIRNIDANEELNDVCITIVSPKAPKLSVGRNMEVADTNRAFEDFTPVEG